MPAGAGDFSDLAIEIIPENLAFRQAESIAFGNEIAWPVIKTSLPAGL
jgi:hypothetical protein